MERLTNIGSNGEIWITDNDETRRIGRKESAYKKLAEYEDLEGLIGIHLKEIAEIFSQNIPEDCKHPRKAIVLTDDDVDKWNGYKNAEEQCLLLRLPCKVGDTVYIISRNNEIITLNVHGLDIRKDDFTILAKNEQYYGYSKLSLLGKYESVDWFLTQAEAEQKLKEMENNSNDKN